MPRPVLLLFLPLLLCGCATGRQDVAARCARNDSDKTVRACMHAAGYVYVLERPGCDGNSRNAACYDVPNQERSWRILGTHLRDS
ncbi:MAG TPA: hypothetical protein VHX99_02855 [Rhizomicrobium sp.]|nr:hypothetical protein [Rhizomicrobium sp.]